MTDKLKRMDLKSFLMGAIIAGCLFLTLGAAGDLGAAKYQMAYSDGVVVVINTASGEIFFRPAIFDPQKQFKPLGKAPF
jgi:hypothetical protein